MEGTWKHHMGFFDPKIDMYLKDSRGWGKKSKTHYMINTQMGIIQFLF